MHRLKEIMESKSNGGAEKLRDRKKLQTVQADASKMFIWTYFLLHLELADPHVATVGAADDD